jgi:predicted pyridoxine 5'-phosphate oxidase superfamily flavin-nucleotide-binding protein
MDPRDPPESAFHAGEVALQCEAGVAEQLGRVGPQVLRDFLTEQHRDFFPMLPFVVIGSIDERAQPSASLLAAAPGFVSSPDPRHLRVAAAPHPDDALAANLRDGASLGILGIQLETRRRNRANGVVSARDAGGFTLAVRQSFGNCQKYIHVREPILVTSTFATHATVLTELDSNARALIAKADTFFIASAHPDAATSSSRSHGVDVSHRGGATGFVSIEGSNTLRVADYRGNNYYNTLGNLSLNPRAGLLFIDFDSGALLALEADAEILAARSTQAYETDRSLRFHVRRARAFTP